MTCLKRLNRKILEQTERMSVQRIRLKYVAMEARAPFHICSRDIVLSMAVASILGVIVERTLSQNSQVSRMARYGINNVWGQLVANLGPLATMIGVFVRH